MKNGVATDPPPPSPEKTQTSGERCGRCKFAHVTKLDFAQLFCHHAPPQPLATNQGGRFGVMPLRAPVALDDHACASFQAVTP